MVRKSNKEIERYYFEKFRGDYLLPAERIVYTDKPDVILEGERKIGVEITNFYIDEGESGESEQVQSDWRGKVISKAQQIYLANGGKRIELSFGFDKAQPIRDKAQLAKAMAELARRIEGRITEVINKEIFKEIPEISFVYLNPKEYEDAEWRVVQCYSGSLMSRKRLVEIVRAKEEQVRHYQPCDAYWLLVVVDFMNRAQDQEIRIDDFEKIDSNIFEKVLVYKTLFGHVLEAK